MDWNELIFGIYNIKTIKEAVKDTSWQKTRKSMLGTTLETKFETLYMWLESNNYSVKSKIQVTNYINALKRGGLIK